MRKFIALLCVTLAAAALMTAPSGCIRKLAVQPSPPTDHSLLSVTTAGHKIKADIDAPAGISDLGDRASIFFVGHEIVVEKERLLLDGKERAKISAMAARVDIVFSNTTLTVTADGTNILSTTIIK